MGAGATTIGAIGNSREPPPFSEHAIGVPPSSEAPPTCAPSSPFSQRSAREVLPCGAVRHPNALDDFAAQGEQQRGRLHTLHRLQRMSLWACPPQDKTSDGASSTDPESMQNTEDHIDEHAFVAPRSARYMCRKLLARGSAPGRPHVGVPQLKRCPEADNETKQGRL